MIDLDDELAQEFLAECREHLDTMEADLLAMERREAEVDEELMNRVFRAVHSVKGGAGFFDLVEIRELAHHTEDAQALIRARTLAPTPERVRILLRATDTLSELDLRPRDQQPGRYRRHGGRAGGGLRPRTDCGGCRAPPEPASAGAPGGRRFRQPPLHGTVRRLPPEAHRSGAAAQPHAGLSTGPVKAEWPRTVETSLVAGQAVGSRGGVRIPQSPVTAFGTNP